MDLGLERAGMQCLWQVEIDDYATKVLEKHWPDVVRHRDVREVGRHNLESVDLICGGFPCQDISASNPFAVGISGERSGLWSEYYRILCELRPRYALIENSSALLNRGLDRVLCGLASIGFDAEWGVVSACAFGFTHTRERLFIVAYSAGDGRFGRWFRESCAESYARDSQTIGRSNPVEVERCLPLESGASVNKRSRRKANGVSARMDRLRGVGNAVLPQVAEWIGNRITEAAK
jgi:DNA (cytosine-5)-methyltransferase 1